MRRFFPALLAALLLNVSAFAQFNSEPTIRWSSSVNELGGGDYELVFKGIIEEGFHTYSISDKTASTYIEYEDHSNIALGDLYELEKAQTLGENKVFYSEISIAQKLHLDAPSAILKGRLNWMSCEESSCRMPEEWEFELHFGEQLSQTPEQTPEPGSIWALVLEAILWGFAMLLTPCVFPMVPMTISFFIKGGGTALAGRFKAFMYGLFIVLLYTVPISLIIGITWLVGGNTVTADIFNWLATHWLPNIVFFIVFMLFAASFFGAFEITLPSSLVNKSDNNSDRKGLAGVFFMALTLVLVSFSCTGPIVGTVLIKSTQGEFWTPMVTMLAFSLAFALPFTLLALFPSLIKKLPKSGGWLNSVKVVLGFIELALGLKFLSVADQTYHWGLLDREVYLAIWIADFFLLGLYLLRKIRFANDDLQDRIGVFRLVLAIIDFAFVIYMLPGMWGAPLKALSGYLPPIETQDFVLGEFKEAPQTSSFDMKKSGPTLVIAHSLRAYDNIDDALAEARESGKPVFVDITGHGCVNCREMEARVWSDSRVLSILRDDYVLVALYNDDKTKLPSDKWVITPQGQTLKDVGRVNAYIARTRFNVNSQPNYALLNQEGVLKVPVRGYDLDVEAFIDFLKSGL